MTRSHLRWSLIAVIAALLGGLTVGLLGWWRSYGLAEDHARRAQMAFDEMNKHFSNRKLLEGELKKARRPADRARYEAMMRSSRSRLVKLEEAAVRHERLARYYGYRLPFKRPEPQTVP